LIDSRIDFDQWKFCVVWATRILFLDDVLSAVPPFLSHARISKPAERRDRSQSSSGQQTHVLQITSTNISSILSSSSKLFAIKNTHLARNFIFGFSEEFLTANFPIATSNCGLA
jgi:hypothetical protein